MASGDVTYTESQGEVVEVRQVGHDNGYGPVPRPRLCHLRRWEGMSYGFNLISKKDTSGHFIDNIDYGFPAYYSGLKDGDRVVEVDGVDVTDVPHRDVVNMIKASGKNGVKMLVVDIETERYFRDKGYVIKSNSNNYQIEFVACPLVKPDDDSNNGSVMNSAQEVTYREGHGKSKKKSNQRDSRKRFSDPEPPTLQELPVRTVYETLAVPEPSSRTTIVNGMTGKKQPNIPKTKVVDHQNRVSTPVSADGWTASGTKTQPVARLCNLIKSPYEPFGFVLRTYQDTNEKMIVKLDKNGIAQRTGLKEMDYVVEINGVNVAKENHNQVTARIHSLGNELSLLVVGVKDMQWFRRQSIIPRAKDCLVFKTKPADKPVKAGRDNVDESNNGKTHPGRVLNAIEQEPSIGESEEFQLKDYNSSESNGPKEVMASSEAVVASENSKANGDSLTDNLNMTAAEARKRITEGAKKKRERKNRGKQEQGRKTQENMI